MTGMDSRGPVSTESAHPETEEAPLRGLTFLNTREASSAPDLTARLVGLGARVIERPLLAFSPPISWGPFDERLARLHPEDWLAFTSATAVRFCLARLKTLHKPPEILAGAHIAAVGAATAEALENHGLPVELVPETYQGEGLLEALLAILPPGARVWLPRAETAREVLPEGLSQAGMTVTVTPVYRTVPPEGGLGEILQALQEGRLDWIVFTSSSTVTHFFRLLPQDSARELLRRGPWIACLGAVTAETAGEHGLSVAVVPAPNRQDLAGLIAAIVAHVKESGPIGAAP